MSNSTYIHVHAGETPVNEPNLSKHINLIGTIPKRSKAEQLEPGTRNAVGHDARSHIDEHGGRLFPDKIRHAKSAVGAGSEKCGKLAVHNLKLIMGACRTVHKG